MKTNISVIEEVMSDEFTKFHILGLPFDAVLHRFTGKDKGNPHDHPYGFTSIVLKGSYIERIYYINEMGNTFRQIRVRMQGKCHCVEATTIHEIIELPDGECWTLILPEKWEREPRFWKFDESGIYSRQWNEKEFTKIH